MGTGTAGHLGEGTLAGYLLGGLGRAETAARERHLRSCGACQEQLASLAEVRRMLSLVPASLVLEDPAMAGGAAGQVPAVPDGDSTAHRYGGWRSRRRWVPAAAIVAAAVAGAVLVPVLVSRTGAPGGGPPPAAVVLVTGFDVSTHVTATMRLQPGPAASSFELRLTGVPAGTTLHVVADRLGGPAVSAGRWAVPPHSPRTVLELFGSVDVKAADLAGFQVLTSGGDVLVDLAMPKARGSASP
jgi:hypothetical protein